MTNGSETEERSQESGANGSNGSEFGPMEDEESEEPIEWIRRQWYEYCAFATKNNLPFTETQESCIRLLHILKAKDAPFNSYESLMRWHLVRSNRLREHEVLGDSPYFIGRKL
jgi:hypothetical protein